MLLLLYDTAARVDEITDLTLQNLCLTLDIHGLGGTSARRTPPSTTDDTND
jgi:site-specific recombinase XerD